MIRSIVIERLDGSKTDRFRGSTLDDRESDKARTKRALSS
jgi:hypothetical protein